MAALSGQPPKPGGRAVRRGVDGESAGQAIMSLPTMGVVARRQTSASLWDYDAEAVGQHSPFRHASTYARGDLMLARANGELFASLNKQESEPPLTERSNAFVKRLSEQSLDSGRVRWVHSREHPRVHSGERQG